ncbi:hypothetical protein C5167_034350 [Papaver somniferum]|uniref:Uncharacterized protein n=1 Tax=Papaver somniferum TaxID=3469 RepID=A0A4Y7KH04_PAPSO|nr:uncharacterized protein LOC113293262 [Papaver somniferum]RZC71185.1 hypothetical protein C5167_034350 [Papaver somniferum]
MASIMSSQGLALVTAMAISGSLVLITLYKQKTLADQNSKANARTLRPCLSSDKNTREKKKKKKKVRFADDVVVRVVTDDKDISSETSSNNRDYQFKDRGICAATHTNRCSLYQGILRDRVHRIAYSY